MQILWVYDKFHFNRKYLNAETPRIRKGRQEVISACCLLGEKCDICRTPDSFHCDIESFDAVLLNFVIIGESVSRREMAEDLAIHYTKLSRILNDKEEPNVELSYRLEKHAGYLIKALTWWKVMILKQEFIISKDEDTRNQEQQKVKNFLKAS